VFVRGDERIAYGRVIEVMGTLQVAGARSVGLLTEPPPPQR
jgi:biopolymer transport protein TolR